MHIYIFEQVDRYNADPRVANYFAAIANCQIQDLVQDAARHEVLKNITLSHAFFKTHPLCSAYLDNDKARLLYLTHTTAKNTQIYFALEISWKHYDDSALINHAPSQNRMGDYLQKLVQDIEAAEQQENISSAQTSPTKKLVSVYHKNPCILDEAQYSIARRNNQGTIFLGSGGVGKTLTAKSWMLWKIAQGVEVTYVTLSDKLCNRMLDELKDSDALLSVFQS